MLASLVRFCRLVIGEAVRTLRQDVPDLDCREAPRLIADLEEYAEARVTGLRVTRLRRQKVRGRGTDDYCCGNLLRRESQWPLGWG